MSKDHFRARQLIAQGRHAEAVDLLRKARLESPWSSHIAHDLALALANTDRTQEAIGVAEQMVADDPDDAFAHATLGFVQLRRGLARECEESFSRALALSPEDASIHGLLARAHLERGKPADALAATDRGLALDPQDDLCLSFRAQALLALGRADEARAVSARLLELDPEDPHNHTLLGHEKLLAGRGAEALPHFREALRLDPDNDDAREGLVLALKARSPIFSATLRGMIALERLGLWKTLALLVGFLFCLRQLEKALAADPVWMPVLAVAKLVAYSLFAISMIAPQIYAVLLGFDRDGRLALSRDERRATRWHLAIFAMILLCVWWGASVKNPRFAYGMAVGFVFIVKLVAAVFESTPGYVRKRMGWLAVATVTFTLLTPVLWLALIVIAVQTTFQPLIHARVLLGLVPVAIGGFADEIRGWLERRRPDAS